MAKTKAFQLYVDDKFIDKFFFHRPLGVTLENNYSIEDDLIGAMCRYYANKIDGKIDFYTVKENYRAKMKAISPNKDSIEANKYIDREQSKLETFARIRFNIDDIKDGYYELHTLFCLYLIYAKLNKMSDEKVKNSRVFKYINLASAELDGFQTINLPNLSLPQLAKELQDSVATEIYSENHLPYQSELTDDGKLIYYEYDYSVGKDVPVTHNLEPHEIKQYANLEPLDQALFVADKMFKRRLAQEMHKLDNGMIF